MSPRGQKQNEQMRAEALEKIYMAALQVFAEYGYHGATMKRIAEATNLSYGLVYHYFPSKEAVFRYIIDASFDGSVQAATAILTAPGAAWQRIVQLSNFLVAEAIQGQSSAYFLVVLHAMTQGKSIPGFFSHVVKRIEEYYQALTPVVREAQKDGEVKEGDPYVLAAAYFAFVQGLALMSIQGIGIEQKITPDNLLAVLRKNG